MENIENTEQTPSVKDSWLEDFATKNRLRQKHAAAALLANTPVYLKALTEIGVGLVIFDFDGGHDEGMIGKPKYFEVRDPVPGTDKDKQDGEWLYLESQDEEFLVQPLEVPEATLTWVGYPSGLLTTMSISLADASENFADKVVGRAIGTRWWDGDAVVIGSLWVDVKAGRVFTECERTVCENSSEELDLEYLAAEVENEPTFEDTLHQTVKTIISALTQAEESEP